MSSRTKRGVGLMRCLSFCAALFCFVDFSRASEFRGIWADAFGPGFHNAEQVKQLVKHCREYNFNAVFVQMRKRGDAFYVPQAPNEDPRTTVLAPDFDALAEIIKQCHSGEPRIEVHCWVLGYLVWAWDKPPAQPEHVFNRHPEYFTKDSTGKKLAGNAFYLDPGHPDATLTLYNTAKDIVSRYDIDGLHWDYLRYPNQDSGYNETAIQRYKEESGTKEKPLPSDKQFCEWRRRQVTDFVRWTTADLLEIKPKLVISASVFSNYRDSADYRFADWVAWNREGTMDVTIPMDFSPDNQFVFNPRADFALTNQGIRTIYLGQGAYMNTKSNTLVQLSYSRSKGFNGTVLYSYRRPILPDDVDPDAQKGKKPRPNVIVDNKDAQMTGPWKTGNLGRLYGTNYYFLEKGTGENYVKFIPKLPVAGEYEVHEWHVEGTNRAEDTPFIIKHRDGIQTVEMNQQNNGSQWNFLGTFRFEAGSSAEVRVTDGVRNGEVAIADAIRFMLVPGSEKEIDAPPTSPDALLKKKKAVDAETEFLKTSQETTFAFLKQKHQPSWVNVPELSWKTKPANGIIKGTVSDKETGQPVYNAVLTLNAEPKRGQKTEPHGKFAFFEVPPGKYIVTSVTGESQTSSEEIQIKAGQIVSIHLLAHGKTP